MATIDQLLDKAKTANGLDTDSALAKALGVGRAAVSGWRHGQRLPDPVVCATLAGLTGEPLHKVLGIIGEARAISQEEKKVWRRLAATALACFVTLGATLPREASGRVMQSGTSPEAYALCEIEGGWPLLLVPAETAAGTVYRG